MSCEVWNAAVDSFPEGICENPGYRLLSGTVYKFMREPQYSAVGHSEPGQLLHHVGESEGFLAASKNYKKDRNEGSHNQTLWTALFYGKGTEEKDLSYGSGFQSSFLDPHVRLCVEY